MRTLAAIAVFLFAIIIGVASYAYFGFYNVAANEQDANVVRWSLEKIRTNSIERHAGHNVSFARSLDDPEMIHTGGLHFKEEGCVACHGGPGISRAEFARNMQPQPPDLTRTTATLNDAELYWVLQNGIKMTGMPAFGSTHNQEELWAMVAFVRRLPKMSLSEYEKITEASEGGGHHQAEGEDHGAAASQK
ncbi:MULTISPECIES: cytochrome c [Mesorhizobium]|uniref:Mono/diheme cytochrome c family protein n=1 Tax=Mesorhizobium shonense TaxID=1209948 RepID=A0ABV2HY17_9HYPH|nr:MULTISPECIES: cytochrome c [unclassified Mesorhizobium]AZO27800.1 cytochrome c [Mesorhizobium sp. M1B.F.Ca.ET.045.04.1.1]RWA67637.1 MAG: c-type cytochrome [Mesorhizobium sp.]RWA78153.1 MAG: c-type cytochrome [Mesorhizobium sp.]RWD96819.1 MAG: c-type cytochrome [Mesorhizobium sp.]TIS47924.1 MAG: c-type cytochrome [Mesorhizobium sp.]